MQHHKGKCFYRVEMLSPFSTISFYSRNSLLVIDAEMFSLKKVSKKN